MCKDCVYAWPRSEFSFKKYGAHYASFECLKDKHTVYVESDHECEKFEKKEAQSEDPDD